MASIRKRGNSYQVRVNRKGFPAEVKTFGTKAEAERWARNVETAMDSHRYRETVSPGKRGGKDEAIRLLALERDPIEPPRLSRRLQALRRWSHEEVEQVLT